MNSKNESLRRLFRLAAILTMILLAVSVVSWILSELLVRFVAEMPEAYVLTAVKVQNVIQLVADYGLKIAVFAVMIAVAKHMSSQTRANLLKIGGIVGIIGCTLMLASTLTGYVSAPHPAFEGWVSLLDMLSGNPVTRVLIPRVAHVATALCTASFVFHKSPTVNLTAIIKIACVVLLLVTGMVGLTYGFGSLLRYILGLVIHILSIAMFVALTKYYAAEEIS